MEMGIIRQTNAAMVPRMTEHDKAALIAPFLIAAGQHIKWTNACN
jgi:hypothetical protein